MSEILADAGIAHTVCVATEYGAELLEEEMSLKHLTVKS